MRARSKSVSVRLGKVEGTDSSESDDFSLASSSASGSPASRPIPASTRRRSPNAPSPWPGFRRKIPSPALPTGSPGPRFPGSRPVRSHRSASRCADRRRACRGGGRSRCPGRHQFVGRGCFRRHGRPRARHLARLFGHLHGARFGRSVSVIAGEGTKMERDYDFDSRRPLRRSRCTGSDRPSRRRAGGRGASTRARWRPARTSRSSSTRASRAASSAILPAPSMAPSVARKTSFLRDRMGKQVLKSGRHDHRRSADRARSGLAPLRRRGRARREAGHGRGRRAQALVPLDLVGTRTGPGDQRPRRARRHLGLAVVDQSRARAGRHQPEELIGGVDSGFYVTEVIGQGVNMVTGEYSRGASGFWIENGELTFPVSEVTIASNLKDMFMRTDARQRHRPQFRHRRADPPHRRHDACRTLSAGPRRMPRPIWTSSARPRKRPASSRWTISGAIRTSGTSTMAARPSARPTLPSTACSGSACRRAPRLRLAFRGERQGFRQDRP